MKPDATETGWLAEARRCTDEATKCRRYGLHVAAARLDARAASFTRMASLRMAERSKSVQPGAQPVRPYVPTPRPMFPC